MAVEYREVPGWSAYRVGDDGTVWSIHAKGGKVPGVWHQLKPDRDRKGYLRVELWRDGSHRRVKIHRLVLEAFVGPRPDGLCCCHHDDDRTNNMLSNLRWDTYAANRADSDRNGTTTSKLDPEKVATIRASTESLNALADRYGVSKATISGVRRRKSWAHC